MRLPLIVSLILLAGCSARPLPVAVAPPPPAPVVEAPPAPTPANAGLSAAATLWHLRTGLNVAALACRGPDEAAIVAGYNRWLVAHAPALATARDEAVAELGDAGARARWDDEQTRLYNFWAQARGRAAFCRAAADALASDDADLPAFALTWLPALDRPFAPPRLAVDARVFDAPATVALASR